MNPVLKLKKCDVDCLFKNTGALKYAEIEKNYLISLCDDLCELYEDKKDDINIIKFKLQHNDYINDKKMNFNRGNVVKITIRV